MAELLDRKYEAYLRQASCDEIVFSDELKRSLLASATATSGMSNIVSRLLAQNGEARSLLTEEIEGRFHGRPYRELRAYYVEGQTGRLLLGLLENTGSPHSMKIEALREAQKTSDVSRLVSNLQSVKGLSINKPVLVPSDDYLVQRHSRAIVLERG